MAMPSIAVLSFAGISPFHLAVPCLVFGEDRSDIGVPVFEVRVCALEAGLSQTGAGFAIQAAHGLADLAAADVIIVPSWRDIAEEPPQVLLAALRAAHARGATLVGLCLGAFVLAAAGLLDNRRATTHWAFAADLAKAHPSIDVLADDLYVDDGSIITSAGVAAGLDCCLHLLRRLCGADIASRVARRLVVPPHRQGGQAQFIEKPAQTTATSDLFAEVLDDVARQPSRRYTIEVLAKRTHLSRRSFTRRFRQRTGTTFVAWLQEQRLTLARQALETTAKPVEIIALDAGFGSALALRQLFKATLQTSPAAYRRTFQA